MFYQDRLDAVDTILRSNYIFDKLTSIEAQKELFKNVKKEYKKIKQNDLFFSKQILAELKEIVEKMQEKTKKKVETNNIDKFKKIIESIRNRNTTIFTTAKNLEQLQEMLNTIFESEIDEIKFNLSKEAENGKQNN